MLARRSLALAAGVVGVGSAALIVSSGDLRGLEGGPASSASDRPPTLHRVPQRLTAGCQKVAAATLGIEVLCPTQLPATPPDTELRIAHLDLAPEKRSYLIDAEIEDASGETPFHVLIGGTPGGYSMRTRNGRWPSVFPQRDPLRLIPLRALVPGQRGEPRRATVRVLGTVKVGGRPAIVLQLPRYPLGGVHGGHTVVLLDRPAAYYVLSLHWAKDAPKPARAAELAVATAETLAPTG